MIILAYYLTTGYTWYALHAIEPTLNPDVPLVNMKIV
jgi:hypothetical protein